MKMKAIVLLSGGIDSAVTLVDAVNEGREVIALSFDYGQRHRIELEYAKIFARDLDHRIVKLDLRAVGGSALTDSIDVPKSGIGDGVPVTYVPARNTIFIAYAVGLAEVVGAREIWLGVNALDYSGYPDCRPEYIAAYQSLIDLAAPGKDIELRAPLVNMSKAEIIRAGNDMGVDFMFTSSCYDPNGNGACGACDSCRIRRGGFEKTGIADPTVYR